MSLSPWRTDCTYDAVTCACDDGVPWPHKDFQKRLVWSSLMYLQGSHQVISKTTEPVVQCTRLDTGPNKGIGIIALISPHALCNTQSEITTFNLCIPCSMLRSKVRSPHWLNILWWTLAINFSSLLWYEHPTDVASLPYCWDHPWTPTWTLKVTYKMLRSSMYCGLSTRFLFPFQYNMWRRAGHIPMQTQVLPYDNFLFISIKLHSKVMNAVSDHLWIL